MTLPKHTEELCFSTDVFLKEQFTVDDFVNQCRKRVTIECLRDDLDAYYRTLKSAMVELINKDYADFVNLSSNLVGVDKSIDGLATPLTQLKEEVLSIKEAMDAAISAIESKLARRAEIRAKKTTLKRLMVVMESLESLEQLLRIRRKLSASEDRSEIELLSEREEFAAVVLERVAGEFNHLQFNVSQTDNHPLISEITPRIAAVTAALQIRLEHLFQEALDKKDRDRLTHSLQAYASISRQEDAESMFQTSVVHPFLDKTITLKALTSESEGLSGIYSAVLHFFPKQCSLLLELTHPRTSGGQTPRVPGFDFLVNSVWPEVVAVIEERISVIFAPGNPDSFHKNYTTTMEFVSSFESLCPTQGSVRRLRAHPSFTAFLSKWSLPVYCQIRFQEIAGALENSLSLSLAQRARHGVPLFKLELFQALWDCLHKCWSKEVFLPALAHRFWKLTLQLILRTSNWLHKSNQCPPERSAATTSQSEVTDSLTVPQNLHLIHDCKLFTQQVEDFFSDTVIPRLPLNPLKPPTAVKDCMQEAVGNISDLIPRFADGITSQISQSCSRNLEPAHTIPRLYRRTNREVPQGPSSYVGNIFKPLAQLKGEIPVDYEQQWNASIVEQVTARYYEITSEVLTSVKRTEDSLMKLRRNRQSLLPASGMSDDNKIRLQLALDIQEYHTQVEKFGMGSDVGSLSKLLETGRDAKTLALTAPSS